MSIQEQPLHPDSSKPGIAQSPAGLVSNLQSGDPTAATQLHNEYSQRLISLVHQRMNPAFNRRLDPEDVVQSAFRSFFRVVSAEDWSANGCEEKVWSLLIAITLNKLNAKIRFHTAGKRSIDREVFDVDSLCDADVQAAELIFFDELEFVMRESTEGHQRILELLLSGQDVEEVAKARECTSRTVYRVVERVVDQLQSRLGA